MARHDIEQGPQLLTEVLTYYDQNVDDSSWQLYAEVHQKVDRQHESIAIAAFLGVVGDKLSEMRWVTDLTVFNQMRVAAGLQALD